MELDEALADFLEQEGIFQKMFDVIRLVEQDGHYVCKCNSDGSCSITDETCYSVWGKKHRCANCVSQQAYNENRQHVKFEYANDRYYFVIARPVWLQGKKYALEFVMDVTTQFTQNKAGEENLVVRPEHYVVQACVKQIQAFCTEFGMTPSSRARLMLPSEKAAADPLENLIQ